VARGPGRSALAFVFAIGCVFSGAAPAVAGPPASTPDVVVILLDDLPQIDGRMWAHLPTIRDTFIDHGVRFTNAFVETPLCCPSRASYLTGQHTHRHGVINNDGRRFDPSTTIATELDAIGYHTMLVGKYVNYYEAVWPAIPPGWDAFRAFVKIGYYGYSIGREDGSLTQYGSDAEEYSTTLLANEAAALIREAPPDRPLFAWLTPYAPHDPFTPPPGDEDGCAGLARWDPPNYDEADVSDKPAYVRRQPRIGDAGLDLRPVCRTLLAVDDMVSTVRQALIETGRLDDTLIVLAGDNGMNWGAHRLMYHPDLGKHTPYATHIPFLASWPGRFGTAGRVVRETISNIDLAPTICALAGCSMGPYPNGQTQADGRDFSGLLLGTQRRLARAAILHSYAAGGATVPNWWGIRTTGSSRYASQGCTGATGGRCRWLYVEYATGERELYDVSGPRCWDWEPGGRGDPCMLRSRHADRGLAELRQGLAQRLRELRSD
jgi:N-acetylglucosamine-6-sulfatase